MTKRTKKVGVTGKYGTRYVPHLSNALIPVVGARIFDDPSPSPRLLLLLRLLRHLRRELGQQLLIRNMSPGC
jgi:hypothetical protein